METSNAETNHTSAYDALADPTRRRILDLLRERGALRAGDLAAWFPQISRPAVSKHVRVLREAGLVVERPEGRERWYALNPVPLQEVFDWLQFYESLWRDRLARLKEKVEASDPNLDPKGL